jgi:hypothetical protein
MSPILSAAQLDRIATAVQTLRRLAWGAAPAPVPARGRAERETPDGRPGLDLARLPGADGPPTLAFKKIVISEMQGGRKIANRFLRFAAPKLTSSLRG